MSSAATINPERVLKELAELWVTLAKEGDGGAGAGVLRACTMTLVVIAEAEHDWAALGETIAALMPEHPARTISVRLSGAGGRALSDRVYSQCWMPFGQRRQICCEQVEISASDAALADLPSVLRPLAVADLPLILWCQSSRLPGMEEFQPIARMADKIIFDSEGRPLLDVAALSAGGALVGDLAWTRITRWRDMLAHVFENRTNLARLGSLTEVSVCHSAAFRNTAAYMAAWVGNAIPSLSIKLNLVTQCESLRVTLSGDNFKVVLERSENRLVMTVDGVSNFTNLPVLSDYSQMREELGIVTRDPVFEMALARAVQLTYPTS